jgi:hypothetical protein
VLMTHGCIHVTKGFELLKKSGPVTCKTLGYRNKTLLGAKQTLLTPAEITSLCKNTRPALTCIGIIREISKQM